MFGWIDWVIIIVPIAFVYAMGLYSRKYARSVADFLSAGRVCRRYVICVGDIANALSIIGVMSYIEIHYKTGFALLFWQNLTLPLSIIIGLTGFCTYRYRETRSMSFGQFLEMRYHRPLRIVAAALRSASEIVANSIMPAVAARFIIYFLDLPRYFYVFGLPVSTFVIVMTVCLFIAVSIICMGGTLALIITDSIQGLMMYPLLVIFVVFILCKFDWNNEIVAVMSDRGPGESFLNPYEIEKLRDFNVFFLIVTIYSTFMNRANWIGASQSSSAITPHEQKMAGLLGTFRGALGMMFYVLVAITVLTVMNHKDFAGIASSIRQKLTLKAASEVVDSPEMQQKIAAKLKTIPPLVHEIGKDKPLTDKENLDTQYLQQVHDTLKEGHLSPAENQARLDKLTAGMNEADKAEAIRLDKIAQDSKVSSQFQQIRSLFNQQMLAFIVYDFLPEGMTGLFMLLMLMAMISTDDTRIYSAALTVAQDVFLPLFKRTLSPKEHVWLIRSCAIGVGVFFFFASLFMAQLDYIQLFVTMCTTMWTGGAGPIMIFGLYSRFGTVAAAWTSLINGIFLGIVSVFFQRNWADIIYPFLARHGWVEPVGKVLETLSKPFHPYIEWHMNELKCPINAYEFLFITMIFSLLLYVVVSKLTCRTPFNLDRLLHRGKYDLNNEKKALEKLTFRNAFKKIIGITPEYSTGDKVIAWSFFIYSFIYHFVLIFVGVVIWNAISPWPNEWWSEYFYITQLLIPGIVAVISIFWFGIGGVVDLIRLFKALETRTVNHLDNGQVDGTMSIVDKQALENVDKVKNDDVDSPEIVDHNN